MRSAIAAFLLLLAGGTSASAQRADSTAHDKTFFTRADLLVAGVALGTTAAVSFFDDDVAVASQRPRYQGSSIRSFARKASKVQETTLTIASLLAYGVGRVTGNRLVADVGLHAAESVVLGSLMSQAIRGPLGRTRPYVTKDTNQYDFAFGQGFKSGEEGFKHRAFPSIHTSSSVAVATVLVMETNRRHPSATKFVAPILFAASILPGLARIQLDQHWASDVVAGAFMGAFSGYKVVSYSHDHPDNKFDRFLLGASIAPDARGGVRLMFSPEF